jgi:tripartite-type tricarboxylate transporter receptor subunit TctC
MFSKIITTLFLLVSMSAQAQAIKIVVPFNPGGIVDTTNRILHCSTGKRTRATD